MKFGKVENPEDVDFNLPKDHQQTKQVFEQHKEGLQEVYVGCAKWNRKDLKNFYPRGTRDELSYYSTQFNSIELNASFYRMFPEEQFISWYEKAAEGFKFFPKVPRLISHTKRLVNADDLVTDFTANLLPLREKLGMVFLQMPENFHPKHIDRLPLFFETWPKEIPLAIELRHTDWHTNQEISHRLNNILQEYNIASIVTDSAGRRDLLHMRLTTPTAFIRYNGANHPTDYSRLDDWIERIKKWEKEGLKNLYFFVHQNVEKESPLLSAYFTEKLNEALNLDLKLPKTLL